MAADYNGGESVLQWKAKSKQKLESGLPLDALLPALHVENVLTDYEYKQLLPTPLTLVARNHTFLEYLGSKELSAVRRTLSILSRPEHQEYRHLVEILKELFGYEEDEEQRMHGNVNHFTRLENGHSSGDKEVGTRWFNV